MSYNKQCSNIDTEKTRIDSMLKRINGSFEHVDPENATCISSGPSHDEYDAYNQSFSENSRRETKNQIPIKYFSHASASCRNIGGIASETLKPSASRLTTLRIPVRYWSKFKRPRHQLTKRARSYDKPEASTPQNFIYSTKMHKRHSLCESVRLGDKIYYNKDDTKSLDAEKHTSTVDEKCLRSNESGISTTDTNMPPEKIDIYYFDHGTSAYYLTTDIAPILLSDKCVDKIDNAATRFWAEIFGTIHIGMTFVTAFILQLLRFLLRSIIRPLIVGTIQMIADYGFKPFLTIMYNGIIQPILIFLYNIATSFRDFCEPIAEAMGYFIREFVNLFRAIRLIEINPQSVTNNNNHHPINQPT